jgi:hypothetical protein
MAYAAANRPDVQHLQGAPDGDKETVEYVAACVESFERGIGTDFRERCEKFYRQYRGFKRFRDAWTAAGPNDRDAVLYDAKKHWGAHLHIPLSFRTIETMVPRAIAHRPRMLYLPRDERWQENVETVRHLIDAQQDQIDIDLSFQDVMRAGMIYGLGVGKTYWRTEYAPRRRVKRRTFAGVPMPGKGFAPKYEVGRAFMEKVFDDPDFEDVDVFDFMWDPFGADLNRGSARCSWVVHRVWLSLEQCLQRIESGAWNTESAKLLDEDKLRSMGNGQRYDEIWQQRMEASGFSSFNLQTRGEQIHEVWEHHNGQSCITVLDRQVNVQNRESPCMGLIPFQIYRPTRIPKQMVGIGEIEPIEHLQRELDTLRSQRRDAATLALAAGYAYDSGSVEEEDIVFGPAALIEVRNASRVTDVIQPLQRQEVPGSAYQDEQVIRADFDAVTGINDALDPSSGGTAGTATEAQLVQAALSKRIELKSRRFEIEVVRHAARCFLYLDQRMILRDRQPIRQPDDGMDATQAAQEGRWRWFPVGPGELQGEFEIMPEGGTMAAENVPQQRQDAVQILQLFGNNPFIDQRRPLKKALELFGVKDPEAWLKQSDPPVPPLALQVLEQMGVDPSMIQRAVQVAQQQDPQLNPEQQGPDAGQVDGMMQMQPEAVAA